MLYILDEYSYSDLVYVYMNDARASVDGPASSRRRRARARAMAGASARARTRVVALERAPLSGRGDARCDRQRARIHPRNIRARASHHPGGDGARGDGGRATRTRASADGRGVTFDGAAIGRWWERAREAPWDARAAGWREFFAAKAIGAVVEVDNERETVSAKEVESHGLNWPTCRAEALERAKVNTVRFRQNYALAAAAAALLGSECLAFGMALTAFYVFLIVKSDAILGEVSLATNGALKWNAEVVAGLKRETVKRATLTAAVVLFLLSDATANTYALIKSVLWTAVFALLHAVMRPIDLKGTLASIVNDFRAAKSKEELKDAAKSSLNSFRAWVSEKVKPVDAAPVFVVEKGARKTPSGEAQERAPKRESADGAIDVDAREVSDKKFLP